VRKGARTDNVDRGRTGPGYVSLRMQGRVQHLFDRPRPVHHRARSLASGFAAPEHLVRDVESRQHRQAERVVSRPAFRGSLHLLVDIRRQLRNVRGIQRAADWIPLALDEDRNDAF
jgi:hypothetical protein